MHPRRHQASIARSHGETARFSLRPIQQLLDVSSSGPFVFTQYRGLQHELSRQLWSGDVFTGRSRFIMQSLPVDPSVIRCLIADMEGSVDTDHGPQTTPDDRLCRKGGGLQPWTQNSAASS